MPRSTKSTNCGQATECTVTCGAAANASAYAPLVTVARVPMTPTCPLRVAATARRTAGRMTSTTGTSYRSRASDKHAADALLHAMTSSFTPDSTSWSMHASAYRRTSAIGFGPYGRCAVSPRYVTCSFGSWSRVASANVKPADTATKLPIGVDVTVRVYCVEV